MSQKRIISISLHIGDWETGTIGMDATEVGAYWCLTLALYANGGRMTANDDRLKRIARVKDTRTWKRVRGIVLDKFTITDDIITHERVDSELGRINKASKDASDAAHARWERKRRKEADAAAKEGSCQSYHAKSDLARTGFKTGDPEKPNENSGDDIEAQCGGNANHYPLTNNINIIDDAYADEEVDPSFQEWFEAYPAMAYADFDKAHDAWDELTPSEREHARAVVGTYAKLVGDQDTKHRLSPQRWLSDKRFRNIARPRAGSSTGASIEPPEAGTDARVIFDVITGAGTPRHVWHSWLGVDKVVIRDKVLIPRNGFTRSEIDNRWGHLIRAAGYEIGEPSGRNAPGAGHLAHKAAATS